MGRHALVIQSLLTERRFLVHFLLITSLFFLWAFDVNLNDILIPHLNKAFSLTDFQSSFIQVAFFGGYCLPPFLPVGLWRRCATGAVLFLPASSARQYGFFLFALFVMAFGRVFWKWRPTRM
jgi:FHS family L-fucose permease-like MFS transporter